jgi:hypothetical protein
VVTQFNVVTQFVEGKWTGEKEEEEEEEYWWL